MVKPRVKYYYGKQKNAENESKKRVIGRQLTVLSFGCLTFKGTFLKLSSGEVLIGRREDGKSI